MRNQPIPSQRCSLGVIVLFLVRATNEFGAAVEWGLADRNRRKCERFHVINGDNDRYRFVLILYFHRRGGWVRGMSFSQRCTWRFKSFKDLNGLSTAKQSLETLCLQVFMDLDGLSAGKQLLEALCLQVFMDLDGLSTGKQSLETLCLQVFMDLDGLSAGKQLLEALCLRVFMDLDGLSTGKQLLEALCLQVFTDLDGLSTGKQLLEALCLQVYMQLNGLSTGKQLPTFRSSFVSSSSHSDCLTLNMKTQRAFESSVTCHQYTRRNAPEDLSPKIGCF